MTYIDILYKYISDLLQRWLPRYLWIYHNLWPTTNILESKKTTPNPDPRPSRPWQTWVPLDSWHRRSFFHGPGRCDLGNPRGLFLQFSMGLRNLASRNDPILKKTECLSKLWAKSPRKVQDQNLVFLMFFFSNWRQSFSDSGKHVWTVWTVLLADRARGKLWKFDDINFTHPSGNL